MQIQDGDSCYPYCGGQVLQSEIDPDDRYWFCLEEMCDWQGYFSPHVVDVTTLPAALDAQRDM